MGAIQLGKLSNSSLTPLRTTFILAVVFIGLIWSLLTLDMPESLSQISEDGVQEIITQAEGSASGADVSSTIGSSSGKNTGVAVTVQSTEEENNGVAKTSLSNEGNVPGRPLILYAYADSEDGIAFENLKFFIAHGLHAAADFIFILNGETDADVLIPKKDNIRIVQRPNECYDLGAYSEVLLKANLYKKYKRFITMNASIRGPFVPYWSEACWTDMYLNKITEEVKLVGMTANCWPTFHIQSMIWATDLIGIETLLFPPQKALDYLSSHPVRVPTASKDTDTTTDAVADASTPNDPNPLPGGPETALLKQAPGINGCFADWHSAVSAEVSSTSLILAAGYKVDAVMSAYHGNAEYEQARSCNENRDLLWDKGYFGISVHPFETVFMKANRDVSPLVMERHSQWVKQRRYSSYDYCRV